MDVEQITLVFMASDNGSEKLHFQLSPVYVIGLSFNL
jgi:hypothetical protein